MADIFGGGFYSGFRNTQQANQQAEAGQLQQMGALQGILANAQKQQQMQQGMAEEQQLKGMLAQTGGNPEKAIAALMQAGTPKSLALAAQLKSFAPKPAEAYTLPPDGIRFGPDNQPVAFGVPKVDEQIAAKIEAAKVRAEDQRLSRAEQNQARMDMMRLAASLRPPRAEPAPRNLQLTTDAQGNQLIVDSDGTTRPLTQQDGTGVKKMVGADKPMTEFQGKAALYGTRTAQSDKVLKALEDKISTTGLAAAQGLGTAGNFLMSSEQQRVSQAQRDFVNAVLRQESGAVISDAEFANAKKQYFPAPGDNPGAVAQKRANRQLAIQGFARMSGPKGAVDIKAVLDEPLLPGVAATGQAPQAGTSGATGGWTVKPRP